MAKDYDVVILGAGAAGLSAGLYSTRAMLSTLMIESIGPGRSASHHRRYRELSRVP